MNYDEKYRSSLVTAVVELRSFSGLASASAVKLDLVSRSLIFAINDEIISYKYNILADPAGFAWKIE